MEDGDSLVSGRPAQFLAEAQTTVGIENVTTLSQNIMEMTVQVTAQPILKLSDVMKIPVPVNRC